MEVVRGEREERGRETDRAGDPADDRVDSPTTQWSAAVGGDGRHTADAE